MRPQAEVYNAVSTAIDSEKDNILALGEWFWKNPELGYREYKTSRHAVDFLKSLGLTVKENLALTGFRAELDTGTPGPTVALIGELDSLIMPNHPECDPDTGAVHACGHHTSITGLLGAAAGLLNADVAGDLCGKILFIGAPAEEGIEVEFRKEMIKEGKIAYLAGKPQLISEGVFDDVDIALLHHIGQNFHYNSHNGAVNKTIAIKGKSCHAANPQNGINALNGVTLALNAIGLLRESLGNSDKIRIHGIITNGGSSVNIIPGTITMEYMLRAPSIKELVDISTRFDNIVLHAVQAAECSATIETIHGYMPAEESTALGKIVKKVLSGIDPEAVFDTIPSFSKACSDIGDVQTILPAIQFYISGGSVPTHQADFTICDPYCAFVTNARLMALTAVELLYGNGEAGKQLAATKKDFMPIKEYLKLTKSLTKTVSTPTV